MVNLPGHLIPSAYADGADSLRGRYRPSTLAKILSTLRKTAQLGPPRCSVFLQNSPGTAVAKPRLLLRIAQVIVRRKGNSNNEKDRSSFNWNSADGGGVFGFSAGAHSY
jgi:hypothetical protein